MRKRVRKKLHRGEFQELGFSIAWQFTRPLDAEAIDLFFDALIEMVTAKGLNFGGGGGPEQGSGFICKVRRGSALETDRAFAAQWFQGLGPTVSVTVGPLEDAWYGSSSQVTKVREWVKNSGEIIVMPPVTR